MVSLTRAAFGLLGVWLINDIKKYLVTVDFYVCQSYQYLKFLCFSHLFFTGFIFFKTAQNIYCYRQYNYREIRCTCIFVLKFCQQWLTDVIESLNKDSGWLRYIEVLVAENTDKQMPQLLYKH